MALIRKIFRTPKKLYINLVIILVAVSILSGTFYYFRKQETYYAVLPVKFKVSDLPYVDVVIEGTICPLEVDLGSRLEVNIHSDVLEQFDKSPYGVEKWKNFRGTDFEHQTYILPKIEVGSLVFKKPIVVDFPPEEEEEYIIWQDSEQEKKPPETVGCLGRGLLKRVNLLFDMGHSKIIATDSLDKLKSNGYDVRSFTKVPFIPNPKGIVIEVESDLGRMKFLLDTGVTCTMLHEFLYPESVDKKIEYRGFPVFTSRKFIINGTDFGSKDIYFLSMTKELHDIDGFIGMDFIRNHVMYIDFSKEVLYICLTTKQAL